jgi:ATP-dependent Zn protease
MSKKLQRQNHKPTFVETVVNGQKKKKKSILSMLQKATEVHLVVAALIATVTFAKCIIMPEGFVGGGKGSHPG